MMAGVRGLGRRDLDRISLQERKLFPLLRLKDISPVCHKFCLWPINPPSDPAFV